MQELQPVPVLAPGLEPEPVLLLQVPLLSTASSSAFASSLVGAARIPEKRIVRNRQELIRVYK